jgi:hypothetical protein
MRNDDLSTIPQEKGEENYPRQVYILSANMQNSFNLGNQKGERQPQTIPPILKGHSK